MFYRFKSLIIFMARVCWVYYPFISKLLEPIKLSILTISLQTSLSLSNQKM